MRGMIKTATLVIAAVVVSGTEAFATQSPPVPVDAGCRNRHWATVFTNEVSLRWNWSTNASRARLDIAGMNGTFATNFTTSVSNYLWRVFPSDTPSAEDVCDLTLTFYASDNAVVGALTSKLAVVKGAFGAAAVNAVSSSPAWTKVRENVVIPYDAAWSALPTNAVTTEFVIAKEGGAVQTNTFADVAGYFGWRICHSAWGYGVFDLSLTFSGMTNEWAAVLERPLDGFMMKVR